MEAEFYKYQGCGNDFIMIDNRTNIFPKDTYNIQKLCDRHFGIGADGLILLEDDENSDFRMVYYNADGNESTMCGNGGRCIVAFANKLGIIERETTFVANDGFHEASLFEFQTRIHAIEPYENRYKSTHGVMLKMIDVFTVKVNENSYFLNTGSPHHVEMVENLKEYDVYENGKRIRYAEYGTEGSNVNFVEKSIPRRFSIRTYERGVEDETLACGTGATAVAIAMHKTGQTEGDGVMIDTKGGMLTVTFEEENGIYKNVQLSGPAEFVFKGTITI